MVKSEGNVSRKWSLEVKSKGRENLKWKGCCSFTWITLWLVCYTFPALIYYIAAVKPNEGITSLEDISLFRGVSS